MTAKEALRRDNISDSIKKIENLKDENSRVFKMIRDDLMEVEILNDEINGEIGKISRALNKLDSILNEKLSEVKKSKQLKGG